MNRQTSINRNIEIKLLNNFPDNVRLKNIYVEERIKNWNPVYRLFYI